MNNSLSQQERCWQENKKTDIWIMEIFGLYMITYQKSLLTSQPKSQLGKKKFVL